MALHLRATLVLDALEMALEQRRATLECELLDRTRFPNPKAAGEAVFEFIEAWYNPHRRHSALGYRSPVNFEQEIRGPG